MEGEEKIRIYKEKYYSSYGFDKYHKDFFLNWLEEGYLFDPSTKSFKEWSSFKDEELNYDSEKIMSFYSSFQIYWIGILKKNYTVQLNFAGDKIKISSDSYCGFLNRGSFSISSIDEFNDKYKEMTKDGTFSRFFNFKNKKKCLNTQYKNFKRVLEFLMSIEYIYAPYGRSSSKTISVRDENWHEKRNNFDLKKELEELGFTIQEIANLYWNFSKKVNEILGVKRDDWIQLWKSLSWNEKDKLEGHIRLGIEYLQWALMLKKFIEEYCKKEIFDIDEIANIHPDSILKFNISEMNQQGILLRASWNKIFSDPEKNKNHYHDIYKRLFYLANDFELDYHPRLIVFVEGKTELKLLPKFFEFVGNKLENLGIELINIGGISKFFGPNFKVKNSQKKYDTIILNNFLNLINYTLNKWQTLPFFIGDNENNIKKLLNEGICLDFEYNNGEIKHFLKNGIILGKKILNLIILMIMR